MARDARVFSGILFGPKCPSGLPCRIAIAGRRIEASADDGTSAFISFAELKVSFQGENDKYLCLSNGSQSKAVRMLVSDLEMAAALEREGLPTEALASLHLAESRRRRRKSSRVAVLGGIAVALVAVGVALWLLARWAVSASVAAVPPEWERQIGRAAAESVLAEKSVCADPKMNAAIEEIGRRLVMGLGKTPYAWKVRVLDDAEVNAFALPGGYIFVNRGLIERADDGSEVAGVMAHELMHVQQRHGIENVARQLGTMVAVRALLGDIGAVEQALAGNAAQLATMSFNRDQEREADRLGLELVHRAHFDATGLERFMKKLAEEEGTLGSALSFLSTHPASSERARDLEAQRRTWKTHEIAPLVSDWKAAQAACTPLSVTDPDAP